MSFVATIMARLGLDTKPFSDGLRNSNREVDQHERKINNAGKAHDSLVVRSRAASRQIHNFARDLANGADAASLLSEGLMGIGKSLGLSLGALAGLGLGAVAATELGKMVKEYKELNKEVDKLLGPRTAPGDTMLSQIEEHALKASAALKKLRDENSGGVLNHLRDWFFGQGYGTGAIGDQRARQISGLNDSVSNDNRDIATKAGFKNSLHGMRPWQQQAAQLENDYREKIAETGTPGSAKENQLLSMQLRTEMANSLADLLKSVIQNAADKSKFTLSDLAENGAHWGISGGASVGAWNGTQATGTAQAIYAAQQAQYVRDLEARARTVEMSGGISKTGESAFSMRTRAEQIRNSIGMLKDSEKTHEFMDALDASKRLENIERNTGRGLVNR